MPNQRASKARDKAVKLRSQFWDLKEGDVWDRKKHTGFTTLPRTLPIIASIIDSLTKNYPAGQTYLVLWFRSYDEMVLTIESPAIYAAESGFRGERAVSTWRSRMKALAGLGFIESREGPSGDFHYVLLKNPHRVVWNHRAEIQDFLFDRLIDRAHDVGARDFEIPTAETRATSKSP